MRECHRLGHHNERDGENVGLIECKSAATVGKNNGKRPQLTYPVNPTKQKGGPTKPEDALGFL